MVSSTKRIALALSGCLVLGMTACASVPKEAVALSVAVGQDITQLHTGYRESVRFAFNQMRQARAGCHRQRVDARLPERLRHDRHAGRIR